MHSHYFSIFSRNCFDDCIAQYRIQQQAPSSSSSDINCSRFVVQQFIVSLLFVSSKQIDFTWFISSNCHRFRSADESISSTFWCAPTQQILEPAFNEGWRFGNKFCIAFPMLSAKKRKSFRHLMVQLRLYWHSQSVSAGNQTKNCLNRKYPRESSR